MKKIISFQLQHLLYSFCFSALLSCSIFNSEQDSFIYRTDQLEISRISPQLYRHTSFLKLPKYGTFPCNGVIALDQGEAIVFDSPVNETAAKELIDWIEKEMKSKIKAVVVNHFHNDCTGGLQAFHESGIPSYGLEKTIALAKERAQPVPQHGFKDSITLNVGNVRSKSVFYGEGHSPDNLVSYFSKEKILFGGCLIKALKAGKGNLEDANLADWAKTVKKVKLAYPDVQLIIPGHGEIGGEELLEYTIELFSR